MMLEEKLWATPASFAPVRTYKQKGKENACRAPLPPCEMIQENAVTSPLPPPIPGPRLPFYPASDCSLLLGVDPLPTAILEAGMPRSLPL